MGDGDGRFAGDIFVWIFWYCFAYIVAKKRRTLILFGQENTVRERCLRVAVYMVEQRATVRAAATVFGVSKSTVHKDMTERLLLYHPALYEQVKEILLENKAQRHLRGGEATRRKYCGVGE